MQKISELQPQAVFHWFQEISNIPRCSGHEQRISDFLKQFAEERELEVIQDDALNIIIRKPETEGFKNSPWVAIQGHMDMVCEKTPDSDHDFSQDPIELILAEDGDTLHANKTTLGADDGIAIAYGLALLDSKKIPHPNLELIITTNEETGMDGAQALRAKDVKADYLLNLDSEEEGIFVLGCAGGADVDVIFPANLAEIKSDKPAYTLKLSGCHGGHSGQEINSGYANANKLLARLLFELQKEGPVRIAKIEGGSKGNAIPGQACCTFICDADLADKLPDNWEILKQEYAPLEPNMTMSLEKAEPDRAMSLEESKRLLDFLMVAPHGVRSMSPKMEGLVQTSLNAAIIRQTEDKVTLMFKLRSNVDSTLDELLDQLVLLADYFGLESKVYGRYPAWEFDPTSELKELVVKTYTKVYNAEPVVAAIHAGVECGLLKKIMPETEMISLGPDIKEVHTPREHLSVSSVARTWNFLLDLLKQFK